MATNHGATADGARGRRTVARCDAFSSARAAWTARRPGASLDRLLRRAAHCTATLALSVSFAGAASADGGLVRVSQSSGPLRVTVFSAPTPLRAGPIDLSVLVQGLSDDTPQLDAAVSLTLHPSDASQPEITAVATHDLATNKLLYAAAIDLPMAGRWNATLQVNREILRFGFDAEPAAGNVATFWPYLALPFALLSLFALHQWRVARTNARPGTVVQTIAARHSS